MLKVGFLINPVAGCGQFLNLKGSDGLTPSMCPRLISVEKATEFLLEVRDSEAEYYTASGDMGEKAFRNAGVDRFSVIHVTSAESTSTDTKEFLQKLSGMNVDLLVFFGGDGTARDIIDSDIPIPVLGVPLGTKMFSSVFAISVERAAQLFRQLCSGKDVGYTEAEVVDLNEETYMRGHFHLSSYGNMLVPVSDFIMSESKAEYPSTSADSIAEYIIERMEPGVNYIVGPGSTCKMINSQLDQKGSLLGFDLIRDGKLIGEDLSEQEIYSLLSQRSILILSPIGGQGFLIGRGNKQLSGRIVSGLGFSNIMVVSSEEKLQALKGLYLDVDNLTVDHPRFIRVLFGYGRFKLVPVLY